MLHLLEGNCIEVEAFCLSAMDIVLLFLHERRDAVLHGKCQKNTVGLTVLLHLLRTLDSMCGLDGVREWQMESALKLRLALWVSFVTGIFEPCVDDAESVEQPKANLLRECRNEELRLARDLFTGPAAAVYSQHINVLTWLVMDVLVPFFCCLKEVNLWKNSVTGFYDHPFFCWTLATLNSADTTEDVAPQISLFKQRAVEMAVLLGADAALVFTNGQLFTNAYFNTLFSTNKVLFSSKLLAKLTCSIRSGVIRGDRLYGNDPNVLLESLYQIISCETDDVCRDELQMTIDILLSTIAPL